MSPRTPSDFRSVRSVSPVNRSQRSSSIKKDRGPPVRCGPLLLRRSSRRCLALWRRHVAKPWRLSPREHGRFDARREAAHISCETSRNITYLLRNLSKSSGHSVVLGRLSDARGTRDANRPYEFIVEIRLRVRGSRKLGGLRLGAARNIGIAVVL